MNNERKEHLWIPDEEVIRLDKALTARPTPKNISFAEHGQKLSHSLQEIKKVMENIAEDNSLADSNLMVNSYLFNRTIKKDGKNGMYVTIFLNFSQNLKQGIGRFGLNFSHVGKKKILMFHMLL